MRGRDCVPEGGRHSYQEGGFGDSAVPGEHTGLGHIVGLQRAQLGGPLQGGLVSMGLDGEAKPVGLMTSEAL